MHLPHARTHRLLPTVALTAALGLGLAACGDDPVAGSAADPTASSSPTATTVPDASESTITVDDPWAEATAGAEEASKTSVYMVIDNDGEDTVSLTGGSSPVARTVEIHETATVDGTPAMRTLEDGLDISAGRGKLLEPGGYHVSLKGLTRPLSAGDTLRLTLDFSDGSSQTLRVPVRENTEEDGHSHEPGTGEHSH